MKGKRTGIDFSKHELTILKSSETNPLLEMEVFILKKPNTGMDMVQ